jgi:hypothetical protein
MHISRSTSVAIDAPPSIVHAYVADPANLPVWAPDFADDVRLDGDRCEITRGDATFGIRVRASSEFGTVDLLSVDDLNRGAFTRVVPNAAGSEFCFTLFFPQDTDPAAVEQQMTIVEGELDRVRDACEA